MRAAVFELLNQVEIRPVLGESVREVSLHHLELLSPPALGRHGLGRRRFKRFENLLGAFEERLGFLARNFSGVAHHLSFEFIAPLHLGLIALRAVRANVEILVDAVAHGADQLAHGERGVGLFVRPIPERSRSEISPQIGASVAGRFEEIRFERSELLAEHLGRLARRRPAVSVAFCTELEARIRSDRVETRAGIAQTFAVLHRILAEDGVEICPHRCVHRLAQAGPRVVIGEQMVLLGAASLAQKPRRPGEQLTAHRLGRAIELARLLSLFDQGVDLLHDDPQAVGAKLVTADRDVDRLGAVGFARRRAGRESCDPLRPVFARDVGEFGLHFGRRQIGHRVRSLGVQLRRHRRRFRAQREGLIDRFVQKRGADEVAACVVA